MEHRSLNRHGVPIYEPEQVHYPERRPVTNGQVRLGSCCFPGCANTVRPGDYFHPICLMHAFRVYELALEMDRSSDRDRHTWSAMQIDRQHATNRAKSEQKRQAEIRGTQPGWIYYVVIDGLIKIGYATDVKKRLKSYPPSQELLAVHPGTTVLERQMHSQFKAYLQRGREWFADCPEIRAHCAEAVKLYGSPVRFAHHYRDAKPAGGIGRSLLRSQGRHPEP